MKKYIIPILFAIIFCIPVYKLIFYTKFLKLDWKLDAIISITVGGVGLICFVLWLIKRKWSLYVVSVVSIIIATFYMCMLSKSFPSMSTVYGCFTCKNGKYGFLDKFGNEVVPHEYDRAYPFARFRTDGCDNRIGILYKSGRYYLATTEGVVLPAERWDINELDEKDKSEEANRMSYIPFDWLCKSGTYFIVPVGGSFNIINERGKCIIDYNFEKYILHPTGRFIWLKSMDGWDVYDFKKDIVGDCIGIRNNVKFEDCQIRSCGVLAKYNNDVYFSYQDEEDITFLNLSEQEREQNRVNFNHQLLLMIFMNQINQSSNFANCNIEQMNNLYQGHNISGRSQQTIEDEIKKYEQRRADAVSNLGQGIAADMGYSGIISRYDEMIEDCKREQRMGRY